MPPPLDAIPIDEARCTGWFASSPNLVCDNVSRCSATLAVEVLPDVLVMNYRKDVADKMNHATGEVHNSLRETVELIHAREDRI